MVLVRAVLAIYLLEVTVARRSSRSLLENSTDNNIVSADCPDAGDVSNGFMTLVNESTIQFTCNKNYDLVGHEVVSCEDSKWHKLPECVPRCNGPPDVEHGSLEIDMMSIDSMFKKGTLATYDCDDGYTLSPPDSHYRVCEKGIWTGATAACVLVKQITGCPPLHDLRNGYLIHEKQGLEDGFMIGQTVEYGCKTGFLINGESSRRCMEDGTWAPKALPTCIPTDHCQQCPSFNNTVSKVIKGYQTYSYAADGTEVEIMCRPFYKNQNSPCETTKLECIKGQWQGIQPNCVLATECVNPQLFLQTRPALQIVTERYHYPINSTVSYICLPGYELYGNQIYKCSMGGYWFPQEPPLCKLKQRFYYLEASGGEPIVFSLATGAGVLLLLVIVCLIIVCRKRKPLSRAVSIPAAAPAGGGGGGGGLAASQATISRADLADHASLLQHHPPDRLALIAFADGHGMQSGLPTYEEATRDRALGIIPARMQRPPWPSLVGRRSRNSPNPDMLFTRQGSFASHSASTRSGGDPMGSTDTMAVSENSTTVTLDTASSHSGSQQGSCRAHCGSLASFDTSSVLNTEGVPLLEESELEEIQCGDTVSLAMENRSMCDNTSYKLSTASDLA